MATRSFPTLAGEEIWSVTGPPGMLDDLAGYSLQAADGVIGTISAANGDVGRSYLIATGGSWNQGRTVMVPPGIVDRIDRDERVVHVSCSREQVRAAPAFENDRYQDAAYRRELGGYYAAALAPAAPVPDGLSDTSEGRAFPPPQGRLGVSEHWFA